MSLTISSFNTRCRVPRRSPFTQDFVQRVVRQAFTSECRRQLSLLPDSGSTVIRIRRLPLELKIVNSNLSEEDFARLWASEFFRALSVQLRSVRPGMDGIVKVESRTEWLARFISDLVAGSAQTKWEYEEFADVFRLGTVEGVLTVLQRESKEIVPVLHFLDAQGRLDSLLQLFGDFAFEQLFAGIARAQRGQDSDLTVELTLAKLLRIGSVVQSYSRGSGFLATRHRALRVFLALAKLDREASNFNWTPRLVFHALMALQILVDVTHSLPPAMWVDQLTPEALTRTVRSLNPAVLGLLQQVRQLATEAGREKEIASLTQLLRDLTPKPVTPVETGKQSYWLSGDCAGLLLLVGLVQRFEWTRRIMETSLGQRWGPRAVVCCLAGLALRILGKPLGVNDLDPGAAVFAGWLAPASADLNLMRIVLSSASDEDRLELLRALNVSEIEKVSGDWVQTFDCLADSLVREFAARVRGFRKAIPAYVVNTFLRQVGRICIDDKRIFVLLQPNPFHIALHISSADEPVESISWLGNRRLEFQLENL